MLDDARKAAKIKYYIQQCSCLRATNFIKIFSTFAKEPLI